MSGGEIGFWIGIIIELISLVALYFVCQKKQLNTFGWMTIGVLFPVFVLIAAWFVEGHHWYRKPK